MISRFFLSLLLVGIVFAGDLHIFGVPVGQGDCHVIVCPNGKSVLIDLGSSGEANKNAIYSFLRQYAPFDSVIVTHPDADHYNLIADSGVMTGNEHVYIGGATTNYKTTFTSLFKAANIHTFPASYWGGSLPFDPIATCGKDVSFKFLAANAGTANNEMSVVTKVTYGQFSALFPGDFEGVDLEKKLVAKHCPSASDCPLRSTLLKVTHHGATTKANSALVLNAISPSHAYVSSAYPPGEYGHPRCLVTDRLEPHLATGAPTHKVPCQDTNHNIVAQNTNAFYFGTSVAKSGTTLPRALELAALNNGTASTVTQNLIHWTSDGAGYLHVDTKVWSSVIVGDSQGSDVAVFQLN